MKLKETIYEVKRDYANNKTLYLFFAYAFLVYVLLAINMEYDSNMGIIGILLKLSTIFLVPLYGGALYFLYLMDIFFFKGMIGWFKDLGGDISDYIGTAFVVFLGALFLIYCYYEIHELIVWTPIEMVLSGFGYKV
ncbi:hypothetical protein SAMN04488009_2920 [Maribacter sedimenticola]|uniref:Uncharacterized protein n=1 Tax=Maribacter sedimenticola TaxID=228956 RepID=A0ABY1SJF2_9FLAO|nr:hypothetical protein [Maribacter sedimenticola]SNR64286.1 hypothetical protein SAMN04488009_2920 [Maribacter sedimenticola]